MNILLINYKYGENDKTNVTRNIYFSSTKKINFILTFKNLTFVYNIPIKLHIIRFYYRCKMQNNNSAIQKNVEVVSTRWT